MQDPATLRQLTETQRRTTDYLQGLCKEQPIPAFVQQKNLKRVQVIIEASETKKVYVKTPKQKNRTLLQPVKSTGQAVRGLANR